MQMPEATSAATTAVKLFTLQVHIVGGEVLEYRNLNDLQLQNARQTLYTQGAKNRTAPGTWEIISPYRISTAYIIEQSGHI